MKSLKFINNDLQSFIIIKSRFLPEIILPYNSQEYEGTEGIGETRRICFESANPQATGTDVRGKLVNIPELDEES